jgi:hypothetical protein
MTPIETISNGLNIESGSLTINGSTITNGSSGTSGTSGSSGSNGSSGTSGNSGSSGTSGDSLFALTGSVWNTTKNIGITGSLNISGNLVGAGTSASLTYNDFNITANNSFAGIVNNGGDMKIDGVTVTIPASTTINSLTIPGSLTVTGSIKTVANSYFTGSVNLGTKLNLRAQTPLPTGNTGDLAVSGSALYFHNGTAWKAVTLAP